jgi:tight adherence protein B
MTAAALMAAASVLVLLAARRPRAVAPARVPRRVLPAPAEAALSARLARGGVAVDARTALVAVLGVSAAAALAGTALAGSPPLAVGGLLAPPVAAHLLLRGAERRRPQRVAAQLPAVSARIADGLSAGRSLRQAIERAAGDAPEPVRGELTRVADAVATGDRVEDALAALAARVPTPEVEMFVCSVLVNARSGGNLARVLGELGARLEERGRLVRELRGAAAQARMTAWLVGALPVGAAVAVEVVAPGTLGRALGSAPGRLAAAASAAMLLGAVLLIRRLGRVAA